jgi:hypothetical protein
VIILTSSKVASKLQLSIKKAKFHGVSVKVASSKKVTCKKWPVSVPFLVTLFYRLFTWQNELNINNLYVL